MDAPASVAEIDGAEPARVRPLPRGEAGGPDAQRAPHRPQAVDRPGHLPVRRVRRDDAPRPRGHRLLVRLRLHALRAVGLPARRGLEGAVRRRASRPTSSARRIDQTRGWFYSLLMISTLVFDEETQKRSASHARRTRTRTRRASCSATSRDKEGKKESEVEGQLHAARGHPRRGRDGVRRARRGEREAKAEQASRSSRARTSRGSTFRRARRVRAYRGRAPDAAVELVARDRARSSAAASSSCTRTIAPRSASLPTSTLDAEARRGAAPAGRRARRRSRTRRRPRPAPTRSAGSSTRRARRGRARGTRSRTCARSRRSSLVKLRNVYSFFTIYANIDGFDPKLDADVEGPRSRARSSSIAGS